MNWLQEGKTEGRDRMTRAGTFSEEMFRTKVTGVYNDEQYNVQKQFLKGNNYSHFLEHILSLLFF